jgi:photosystem II stability/assembly factor-like uncharacterized protein
MTLPKFRPGLLACLFAAAALTAALPASADRKDAEVKGGPKEDVNVKGRPKEKGKGPAREQPRGGPKEFKKIEYRQVGPAAGGRVSRSTGVPGNPLIYYAATAGGGVWKTSDGGTTWKPIFDDQPASSLGAIAVAPSAPNILYVGAGEANIRGNVAAGNGIYKSGDGGKSWRHVWKQEGQIGQIVVHPTNPDIAYAAVLGHAFGPNSQRGVYRTTDGGKTWKQVLAKDADTGAIDVCLDPSSPSIVFAALWQARRRPWELISGGPGSGLYRSEDGGDTWKRLGPPASEGKEDGDKADDEGPDLPKGPWGRVGVAVAPSDGRRVYALIEAGKETGGLYRSDDGGKKWKQVNRHHYLRQRPWYFSTITVDPRNPDVLWCPTVPLLKSIDGGASFTRVKGPHHGDHHDLWIDPTDGRHMIDSNDGGVDLSANGGETWAAARLPVSQFYHVRADKRVPYHVMGNMQDLGTAAGPSNSLAAGGISLTDWYDVGGGETGVAVPDPSEPNVVYAGEYGGYITRFNYRTRQAENISIYPYNASGHGAAELRYRFQWTAPILVSPHDSKVVYHAANVLFRTADGGRTWHKISPDLTRNERSKQQWSGGPITGDNTGAEVYCTIFAIAESPRRQGLLWAGSDDGLVHVSPDAGKTWDNVTANIPGLPEWGTVVCIEPSPFDEAVAFLVVDAHRLDDTRPYLYKTADLGKTWRRLSDRLPQDVYLHAVREDPARKGLLYVGTERGVVFSLDDGGTWRELKLNLPTAAVHDLVVKDNDLVVATHGRSLWIFDDLTPVRHIDAGTGADMYLFPVVAPIRWRYHQTVYSTAPRDGTPNPPRGAVIHYRLSKKVKDLTLTVLDAQGQLVRKLTTKKSKDEKEESEEAPDAEEEKVEEPVLPRDAGLHRVVWDLRYQGAHYIKGAKIDTGQPRRGPLVLPGTYTVKLSAAGKTLTTTVEVRPDPRVQVPPEELKEQLALELQVRDDIDRLVDAVARLRAVKRQLASRNELLGEAARTAALRKESKALAKKLDELEEQLHNPRAEVAYDILAQKGGAKLYSQLVLLFVTLQEADGAPTQGVREMHAEFQRELDRLLAGWEALVRGDVALLNERARALDVPGVLVPPASWQPREAASKSGKGP